MSPRRRLSQNLSASANKLRLETLNKILKPDSSKRNKNKDKIVRQVSRVALTELLKNTNQTGHELPDFRTFLRSKDNVNEFRSFLKTQYCHENIDFYLACERYKHLDPNKVGKEMIKFMATQIYNDYLSPEARQPVNVNYDCLRMVLDDMKDPKPDLLIDAQMEIFNLMKADCFPRFCKTWQLEKETAKKILKERSSAKESESERSGYSREYDVVDSPFLCSSLSSKLNDTTSDRCFSKATTASHVNLRLASLRSSSSSRSCTSTSKSSHSLGSSQSTERNLIPVSSYSCPDDCPYYKVGLPCQRHSIKQYTTDRHQKIIHQANRATSKRDSKDLDLIDNMDLRRMHYVPDQHHPIRRTPPPPPLPPRPDYSDNDLTAPVLNKKNCPYVGKVFDV